MSVDSAKDETFIGLSVKGEFGVYRIISAIGAGGMGSVYLGEADDSGRKVAVKFLHAELSADDSSSRERFEREMRVLQDLKAFRGIVQFEDGGQIDNGQMFLVMEYVAAPTLDKIISENANGLGQIRAIQIVVEILSVLEPIHHRRFVHRDLKPHNICVYEEPLAVRLLDFGLSKPYMEGLGYEKVTRRMQGKGSEIPGSPHYMAVEQFLRPKEVDARTDLYSCGIILYELLAGIPPFRGIYLQDILQQHKENPPPPIDSCADGGPISYRLWAVIEKALSKKAESRYQSSAEFKEALFDVLNVLNKRKRPKKVLDSKYRMIKKIGVGGNSEVFEVETREGKEKFALKIAREGASDWDEETLMNESDRALNHDNIVRIHEFGTFEGRPALAMELLTAGSLEDILEKTGDEGLPENVFYRTMIDICRGLHHAHQKNIVHRDVKPGNMLRSADGRTKVCDFGIAKRFEQQGDDMTGAKNTTLAKGTAQYISPEQCDLQGRVDRRADIYCLGVMMYEMLAGELPFTDGILIMQHLQTNPPPLLVKGQFRNPDALCEIVGKAMHKSPDQRYQSMKELAQDLVRVSKLEPQKKTHKAVTLKTIPEEWANDPAHGGATTVGMTQALPQTQTGMSGKKVALIVTCVVVALVGGFLYVGSLGNDGGDSPDPITIAGDPAKAEFDSCRALIDEGNYAKISGFQFEELTVDSNERRQLSNLVLDRIRNEVFNQRVNAEKVPELTETLRASVDALMNIDPGAVVTEQAKSFADEAARFLAATESSADSWQPWNSDAENALSQSLKTLNDFNANLFPRDRWDAFLDSRKVALWANNLAATIGAIKALKAEWNAEIEDHVAALIRRKGEPKAQVLAAMRDWVESALTGVTSLDDLGSLVLKGAVPAAGLVPEKVDLITGPEVANNARTLIKSGVSPADRLGAVTFGLVASVTNQELQANLKKWLAQRMGPDVFAWPQTAAALNKSGFPLSLYAEPILQGLESVLASTEFNQKLAETMGTNDATEQDRLATTFDDARDQVLALVRIQPNDPLAATFDQAWGSTFLKYRRSANTAWEGYKGQIAELEGNPEPARLFQIIDNLQKFLKDYSAEESHGSLIKEIIQGQAARLNEANNPLILLGFAQRYGKAIGFTAKGIVTAARNELSGQILKSSIVLSPKFVDGQSVRYVNAKWPQ